MTSAPSGWPTRSGWPAGSPPRPAADIVAMCDDLFEAHRDLLPAVFTR
jgi:hypothetical protein